MSPASYDASGDALAATRIPRRASDFADALGAASARASARASDVDDDVVDVDARRRCEDFVVVAARSVARARAHRARPTAPDARGLIARACV